jgi:small subunit ribosomal protein S4
MRKGFKPRYKACFQLNENLWATNKISKFNSNKWQGIKRKKPLGSLGKKFTSIYYHLQPNTRIYGLRLKAKQLMKKYYGDIREKQLTKYYKTVENFNDNSKIFSLIESRLDVVIYRSLFASTLFDARQLINHGFFLVNGVRVKQKSYLLKKGDIITVKDKNWDLLFDKILTFTKGPNNKVPCPPHIQVDYNTLTLIFLYLPKLERIPYPVTMDMNLAKDYYK